MFIENYSSFDPCSGGTVHTFKKMYSFLLQSHWFLNENLESGGEAKLILYKNKERLNSITDFRQWGDTGWGEFAFYCLLVFCLTQSYVCNICKALAVMSRFLNPKEGQEIISVMTRFAEQPSDLWTVLISKAFCSNAENRQ